MRIDWLPDISAINNLDPLKFRPMTKSTTQLRSIINV